MKYSMSCRGPVNDLGIWQRCVLNRVGSLVV